MKRFHFRLETLLKVRRMAEEQAHLQLSVATQKYINETQILCNLENALNENIQNLCSKQQELLTIEEFKIFNFFNDKIKRSIVVQSDCVANADKARLAAMRNLEDAVKQRKIVEKLREDRYRRYQTEVLCEEQKFLDEIGTQIFVRRN